MTRAGRQTALIAAVFIVGVLGVTAAFFKSLGGFSGAVEIARRILERIF